MQCSRCGTKNPEDSLNCFNCGQRMNEPPQPAPFPSRLSLRRAQFHRELADSVLAQDDLMMVDIAKILHKMPGSSVVAMRKYQGTVFAGLVVLNGNISLTMEMFRKGILNPTHSPSEWTVIPESKLNLVQEFTDPPEAALAFFVLTPSGGYAFALSHIVRSDGDVQWVSNVDFVHRVADVLVELGVCQADRVPDRTLGSTHQFGDLVDRVQINELEQALLFRLTPDTIGSPGLKSHTSDKSSARPSGVPGFFNQPGKQSA